MTNNQSVQLADKVDYQTNKIKNLTPKAAKAIASQIYKPISAVLALLMVSFTTVGSSVTKMGDKVFDTISITAENLKRGKLYQYVEPQIRKLLKRLEGDKNNYSHILEDWLKQQKIPAEIPVTHDINRDGISSNHSTTLRSKKLQRGGKKYTRKYKKHNEIMQLKNVPFKTVLAIINQSKKMLPIFGFTGTKKTKSDKKLKKLWRRRKNIDVLIFGKNHKLNVRQSKKNILITIKKNRKTRGRRQTRRRRRQTRKK